MMTGASKSATDVSSIAAVVNLAREVMGCIQVKIEAGIVPSEMEIAALRYARAHLDRLAPSLHSNGLSLLSSPKDAQERK